MNALHVKGHFDPVAKARGSDTPRRAGMPAVHEAALNKSGPLIAQEAADYLINRDVRR